MRGSYMLDRRTVIGGLAVSGLSVSACGSGAAGGAAPPGDTPEPTPTPTPTPSVLTRTWRMGFSPNPPRFTVQAVLQGIDRWSRRAELAIVHEELPWADLLAGMAPAAILTRDKTQLVQYLRAKGLRFTFMLDLTNGLDRTTEARALIAAGRSLTEPAVQALARDYALAVETMLAPDWLGLAAETNLIRRDAPAAVYAAVRDAAVATEAALAAASARSLRYVSIQAETAWGLLGSNDGFVGIARDLADFPFSRALGISSYPYFDYGDPNDIPDDYYTRIVGASGLPVIVTEGGWTSASVASVSSTPDKQARYIARHAGLLDSVRALGYFQLQFADMDLSTFPGPVPPLLPLFTSIGLVDPDFAAKPALAVWDGLFARAVAA
jgi:hypothetical protein